MYTYAQYLGYSEMKINNLNKNVLDEKGKMLFDYSKLNLVRSFRIQKTYKLKPEIVDLFNKIDEKQIWLVITEDWCGDSAQNLPYIYKYVENLNNIDFRIVLRDDNLNFVDNYFNHTGARSIPRILGFNSLGNELFRWGPRPKVANNLVKQLKSEGKEKTLINEKLHLWYGRNKGRELENELAAILNSLIRNN
ncbi:hypothetical protein BMS3Abin04_00729 [bacterium BMS3Abin04]|nr:hypothetical protein BMS3Abin04_00729 [bacterium BMS3Abin04]